MDRDEIENDKMPFERRFVQLNDTTTEVLTLGCPLGKLKENGHDTLVLVMIGNPGIVIFYEEFMARLFSLFEGKLPIWSFSHAGHTSHDETTNQLSSSTQIAQFKQLPNSHQKYMLEGQIEHKKKFIDKYIPKSTKLILIGHSIGSHFSICVMRDMPERPILKTILLFPAIYNLSETDMGKKIVNFTDFWLSPCLVGLRMWAYLPERAKMKMVEWYFKSCNIYPVKPMHMRGALNFLHPDVFQRVFLVGKDYALTIQQTHLDTIAANQGKFIIYYGADDHWCPRSNYEDFLKRFPNANIKLCQNGMEHAFCIKSSTEMADLVAEWLTQEDFLHQ